jgi:hypothetical protein
MNSDEDKLYMKLVPFDEIYNFLVQTLFIWSHLEAQKIDILSRSRYRKLRSRQYINFLNPKITSNEKHLNYKVVDLIESYKLRLKFISIRVHTKRHDFLKTDWP